MAKAKKAKKAKKAVVEVVAEREWLVRADLRLPHFYQEIEGGFWYRLAWERLLGELEAKATAGFRASGKWVEVGVFHGQSLAWLAVELWNRGIEEDAADGITVIGVDDFRGWAGVVQGDALRSSFEATRALIASRVRPELWEMSSAEAASKTGDGTCDVVWLDGTHTNEAVLADCRSWWPKVKAGGVLGGDDWVFGDGVRSAVEQFAREVGVEVALMDGEREGKPWPSWVMRKPA